MIAAMVIGLLVPVLALVLWWLVSPSFRRASERPKFQMLEREAMYQRAETKAGGDDETGSGR